MGTAWRPSGLFIYPTNLFQLNPKPPAIPVPVNVEAAFSRDNMADVLFHRGY